MAVAATTPALDFFAGVVSALVRALLAFASRLPWPLQCSRPDVDQLPVCSFAGQRWSQVVAAAVSAFAVAGTME